MITSKNYNRYITNFQMHDDIKEAYYPLSMNDNVNMRLSDNYPITPLMVAIWNKRFALCVTIITNPDLDLTLYTTECNPITSLFDLLDPADWQYDQYQQLIAILISKNIKLVELASHKFQTTEHPKLVSIKDKIIEYHAATDIKNKIYLSYSISLITFCHYNKISLNENLKCLNLTKQHVMQVAGNADYLLVLISDDQRMRNIIESILTRFDSSSNNDITLYAQPLFNCFIALGNYHLKMVGHNVIQYFSHAKKIADSDSSVLGNENRDFLNACDRYSQCINKNSNLYDKPYFFFLKYSDMECIVSFISAARSGSQQANTFVNNMSSAELHNTRFSDYTFEASLPVKLLIANYLGYDFQTSFSKQRLSQKQLISLKSFIEALEIYYSHPEDVETVQANIKRFNNLKSIDLISEYASIYSTISQYQLIIKIIAAESSEQKFDNNITAAAAESIKDIISEICATFDDLLTKFDENTKNIIYLQPFFILQDIINTISPYEMTDLEIILREKMLDLTSPYRNVLDLKIVADICENIKRLTRISTLSAGPRYYDFYRYLLEKSPVLSVQRSALLDAISLGNDAAVSGIFYWKTNQQSFQEICECLNSVLIKNNYDIDVKIVSNILTTSHLYSVKEKNLSASLAIVDKIRDNTNLINLIDKKLLHNDVNPALIRLSLHYLNQKKIRRGCYFNCLLLLQIELHQHKFMKVHHYSDKSKDFIFQRAKDFITGLAQQEGGEHQKLAQWYLEAITLITQLIKSDTLIFNENITAMLVGYGLKSPFKSEFMYAMITYPQHERFIENNLQNFKLLTGTYIPAKPAVKSKLIDITSAVELVPLSNSPYTFMNRNKVTEIKPSVTETKQNNPR